MEEITMRMQRYEPEMTPSNFGEYIHVDDIPKPLLRLLDEEEDPILSLAETTNFDDFLKKFKKAVENYSVVDKEKMIEVIQLTM